MGLFLVGCFPGGFQEGNRAIKALSETLLCLLSRNILWIFFSYLPGNFALKNGGDFWWIFSGLRFPRNEARKLLKIFGENSERNSGQNSGQKFEKFGELSDCDFPDLTKRPIKVGKRPIKEEKRPIKATGLFLRTLKWWKTASLEKPTKRPMTSKIIPKHPVLVWAPNFLHTYSMLHQTYPVGQKRQIDVAGQKLPRDNFCLSLVSQLPSPRG